MFSTMVTFCFIKKRFQFLTGNTICTRYHRSVQPVHTVWRYVVSNQTVWSKVCKHTQNSPRIQITSRVDGIVLSPVRDVCFKRVTADCRNDFIEAPRVFRLKLDSVCRAGDPNVRFLQPLQCSGNQSHCAELLKWRIWLARF